MVKKAFFLLLALLTLIGCNKEEDTLENVSIEVLLFEFTPDTGNNSSRFRYEIRFVNPNDSTIRGFYTITINTDGLITSQFSSNLSPCYEIEANSECTLSFDEEESFVSGLATTNSIELISVEYEFEN